MKVTFLRASTILSLCYVSHEEMDTHLKDGSPVFALQEGKVHELSVISHNRTLPSNKEQVWLLCLTKTKYDTKKSSIPPQVLVLPGIC
jgi:hypothetical protein